LATLLLAGAASGPASAGDSGEEPAPEQCLNVAVDHAATELAVFVTLFGAIGFGVSSPEPGDGLAFLVYVVPELCGGSIALLTTTVSENPVFRPQDSEPLLP
jgi:hypothetical protein